MIRCQDCGFEGESEDFVGMDGGDFSCPECGSDNVETVNAKSK